MLIKQNVLYIGILVIMALDEVAQLIFSSTDQGFLIWLWNENLKIGWAQQGEIFHDKWQLLLFQKYFLY